MILLEESEEGENSLSGYEGKKTILPEGEGEN